MLSLRYLLPLQVRQAGEASVSKMLGAGSSQGGQRLLLPGLLQGKVHRTAEILVHVWTPCWAQRRTYMSPHIPQTCSNHGRSTKKCIRRRRGRTTGCTAQSVAADAARPRHMVTTRVRCGPTKLGHAVRWAILHSAFSVRTSASESAFLALRAQHEGLPKQSSLLACANLRYQQTSLTQTGRSQGSRPPRSAANSRTAVSCPAGFDVHLGAASIPQLPSTSLFKTTATSATFPPADCLQAMYRIEPNSQTAFWGSARLQRDPAGGHPGGVPPGTPNSGQGARRRPPRRHHRRD